MSGDWSDSWKPPPPSYAERIRRGEHDGRRRKGPGERFSPSELAALREQARALCHLQSSGGWLPERDGEQAPLLPERALEGA